MTPVSVKVDGAFVPRGTMFTTYAEDQKPYLPLPCVRTPDGRVMSAWQPNTGELALLATGVPVYITLHTFNEPLQPLMVTVGPADLR